MKSTAAGHATKLGGSSLLMLLAVLIVVGVLLFPARQEPSNSLPALTPDAGQTDMMATLHNKPDPAPPMQNIATDRLAQMRKAPTDSCNQDPSARTLQQYRKLSAQDWRSLNQWQRERGLSQTRLRADGELSQEPSSYLHYDTETLRGLADGGDADAQYWLAIKYRESGVTTVQHGSFREDSTLVVPRLLNQAARAGHVQAMLATSQLFHEQLQAAGVAWQNPGADHPDLHIKRRAWQRLAAWRMGRLPDPHSALPIELEQQAAALTHQLIEEIQLGREQQGLAPFDNVVPMAVIGLLQAAELACSA